MENDENVKLILRWRNGSPWWMAWTDTERFALDPDIYDRVMREEFAKHGLIRKTWSEYMRRAEEAWKRQCAIEARIRANLDFWRRVPGIEIVPLKRK